jgi:hypothetical protein
VRNPDWTRDETILLMELYRGAPRATRSHPGVIALSLVLRAAARREGRSVSDTFRNPAGIAMRLRNFAKHDPSAPVGRDAGLRPGGVIDIAVWRDLGGNAAALAVEVTRIRRLIAADDWALVAETSRGPTPSFGIRPTETTDGRAYVYLLVVDGPIEVLAPNVAICQGWSVVKIGRSVDVERRMADLSGGLPPSTVIRYMPIAVRPFSSGCDAHRFERQLLDLCDRRGWALGGEFAYAPLDELMAAMSSSGHLFGNSGGGAPREKPSTYPIRPLVIN